MKIIMNLTGIILLVICFPCFSLQMIEADVEKKNTDGRKVVGFESKEIMPKEVVAEPAEVVKRDIDKRGTAEVPKVSAIAGSDTVELKDEVSKAQRIDALLLSWQADLQSGQDNDQSFLQNLVGRTLYILGRTADECQQAREQMASLTDMDDFLKRIKAILLADASNEQIDMMIQWQQSEMAKTIKAINDKTYTTDNMDYISDNYKDIIKNSDEKRIRIAKDIFEHVDLEASMTSLYRAIVTGLKLSENTGNQVDHLAIAEAIFLNKYQEISVEELKQYEMFVMYAGGIFCRAIYRAADDIFSELEGNEKTGADVDKKDSTPKDQK